MNEFSVIPAMQTEMRETRQGSDRERERLVGGKHFRHIADDLKKLGHTFSTRTTKQQVS